MELAYLGSASTLVMAAKVETRKKSNSVWGTIPVQLIRA